MKADKSTKFLQHLFILKKNLELSKLFVLFVWRKSCQQLKSNKIGKTKQSFVMFAKSCFENQEKESEYRIVVFSKQNLSKRVNNFSTSRFALK